MSTSLKVKKRTPKRKKKKSEKVVVDGPFLAKQTLFNTLDESVQNKIASLIQHKELKRKKVLFEGQPMDDAFSPVFLILYGDVAVYRTIKDDQGTLHNEVSTYLTVGEVYVQKLHITDQTQEIRVESMCPVKILEFTYNELNYLFSKSIEFRNEFSSIIQSVTQRQAQRFNNRFQKEIAAFFVKERLTFARRVKIKRMDICIECDGCYDACRTRHGTDRLGASEVKYGITEIPQNCHNCVVPECIDKCNYGHITRDETTSEIVISDNCVGCTACSKGCSFGAIQMHPVETLDIERYFPNRDPEAKGKQIAQKCDNCTGYEDLACISACPTGAMFQVNGPDLFDYWEQFNVHKNPGFDTVISPEDSANKARPWWIVFTALNLILISYEWGSRTWIPEFSFGHFFKVWGLTTDFDFAKPLSAAKGFGYVLGYMSAISMTITQLYTLGRKHAPKLGSIQMWMEIHIWFGFLGFIYGFYHAFCNSNWKDWTGISTFVLFTTVMLTGILGRYFLFHIPRSQGGKELELEEIEQQLQTLNQEIERRFEDRREGYTMMLKIESLKNLQDASGGEKEVEEEEDAPNGFRAAIAKLRRLVIGDQQHEQAIDALREEMGDKVKDGQTDEVLALMKEKARLVRGTKRASWLSKVLKSYRVFHVNIGYIIFVILVFYILYQLKIIRF
jgi:Fe-S-cluster-containing hydrogenase component 2